MIRFSLKGKMDFLRVVFQKRKARPILLVVLLAFACARPIAELHLRGEGEKTRSVFVVNHGWHSGIVIKKGDILEGVLPEVRDFPDAEYLEIGWGDRDYYQVPDPGLGLALKKHRKRGQVCCWLLGAFSICRARPATFFLFSHPSFHHYKKKFG